MASINKLIKKGKLQKVKWNSTRKLQGNPFKQGIVSIVYVGSPKNQTVEKES